jgi:hypothetical protein
MSGDSLNVLVEAKKEYMAQLYSVLCPLMIETFENLYSEAVKESKGRDVLKMYQKMLRLVKDWNNDMINQHITKLTNNCSWFSGLVTAVFVSFVKILTSVRLSTENKKISIKLPTCEDFLHRCYKLAAINLYKDPYIFHDEMSESARDENLTLRFCSCIEAAVKEFLPIQTILQTYMTQTGDIEMGNEEVEDTEDPDVTEGLTEEAPMTQEPEAPQDPTSETPPTVNPLDPIAPIAPITPDDAENVKNIDISGTKGAPQEEDDGSFFNDASD